jgi:hypothetical protein
MLDTDRCEPVFEVYVMQDDKVMGEGLYRRKIIKVAGSIV